VKADSSGTTGHHWLMAPQYPYDAGAMSAASVLIIVVALLCVALVAVFGILWAALRFGVGEDDED
jgi:hypothetical protein